jgi:lipid-A-disaccharide synthase-like uncharacterized protein
LADFRLPKAVLSFGFFAFAAVNLEAMYSTNSASVNFQSLFTNTPLAGAAYAVRPSEPWQLLTFHIAMDALVLSAIWLIQWFAAKREVRRVAKLAA